jgi:ADP-ribose pyrophosphatase YjhB (NUDIX family)
MEEITYQGNLIEILHKEVDLGKVKRVFELARRSPGARLIIPKGDSILITREYRHETNGYDYRIPGGKVYDSLAEYKAALSEGADIGEAAEAAAVKEAREEAGIEVTDLSFFHKSVCGATIVWDLFYFVVNEFRETDEQHLEHGEDITYEFINKEKVQQMCLNGSISEERSALVLLRYLNGKA